MSKKVFDVQDSSFDLTTRYSKVSFDVKLASAPTANVTVTIKLTNMGTAATVAYTPAAGSTANATQLTFTSANWNTAQSVVADITLDAGATLRPRVDANGAAATDGYPVETEAATFSGHFVHYLELTAASTDTNLDGGLYAIALYDVRTPQGTTMANPVILDTLPAEKEYEIEAAYLPTGLRGADVTKVFDDILKNNDLGIAAYIEAAKKQPTHFSQLQSIVSTVEYMATQTHSNLQDLRSAVDRMPKYVGMNYVYFAFKVVTVSRSKGGA